MGGGGGGGVVNQHVHPPPRSAPGYVINSFKLKHFGFQWNNTICCPETLYIHEQVVTWNLPILDMQISTTCSCSTFERITYTFTFSKLYFHLKKPLFCSLLKIFYSEFLYQSHLMDAKITTNTTTVTAKTRISQGTCIWVFLACKPENKQHNAIGADGKVACDPGI